MKLLNMVRLQALQSFYEIYGRWKFFPRLFSLLWDVGARDVLIIVTFSLVTGITPLLIVACLQRLVDSAVAILQSHASLKDALLWALALFGANILQRLLEATSRWLGEITQDRLKLKIQARVLQKAGRLGLSEFERPEIYDQLHRAQQGLDTRLFSTIQQLIPIPTSLVTAFALLGYLGQGHVALPIGLALGVIPTAFWSTRYSSQRYLLERQNTHQERLLSYFTRLMTERPAAEIRLFGLQQYMLDSWTNTYSVLRAERLRLQNAESRFLFLRTIIDRVVFGCAIVVIVALILTSRISLGAFTGYLAAIERFTEAIYGLLWNLAAIDSDLRYVGDLIDYLELSEEDVDAHTIRALQDAAKIRINNTSSIPTIEMNNVSFFIQAVSAQLLTISPSYSIQESELL